MWPGLPSGCVQAGISSLVLGELSSRLVGRRDERFRAKGLPDVAGLLDLSPPHTSSERGQVLVPLEQCRSEAIGLAHSPEPRTAACPDD